MHQHTHGGTHRHVQAHRCGKGSWQLSREQHWTGLKAARWISRNYCGGGAPLQLKQDAEGWVLGEQGKEGSHRGLNGTAKHSLGHSMLSGVAALGFSGGGVTLHRIPTSLFQDAGSDLGPLQWKQCVDHWTAREFPTLGLFQQRQCRGWGHLWAHGGCRQRLG